MTNLRTFICAFSILATNTFISANNTNTSYKISIGIGNGIPYGFLGFNCDINIINDLYFSIGIGSVLGSSNESNIKYYGIGYNVGFKYYFNPPKDNFRTRVSFFYGINRLEIIDWGIIVDGKAEHSDGYLYRGESLGYGAQWMFGKNKKIGIDFDIFIGWSGQRIAGISLGFRVV